MPAGKQHTGGFGPPFCAAHLAGAQQSPSFAHFEDGLAVKQHLPLWQPPLPPPLGPNRQQSASFVQAVSFTCVQRGGTPSWQHCSPPQQ
jgi:hypothetical protein